MSYNFEYSTTFVPIAVYIPIAIPVSSSLTQSEVQTILNNSLTSMNSKTFDISLTENKTPKNEIALSPSLSNSIDKLNQRNFSLIESINSHLQSPTSGTITSRDINDNVSQPEAFADLTCSHKLTTCAPLFQEEFETCNSHLPSAEGVEDRPNPQTAIDDLSHAESRSSSDQTQSLVRSNGEFSTSVIRQISGYLFSQSFPHYCETSNNLHSSSAPISTIISTTPTKQQCTTTTWNTKWYFNWNTTQCNCCNNQSCCVFSNVSNNTFFPVCSPLCSSSPMPMPSSSPSSISLYSSSSSSLLLLTLLSVLLYNISLSSVLLSLPISINLRALQYCLFKGYFKQHFSFSDQQPSQTQQRREREREEEEEEGEKGGKGGIIIIGAAAAAYYDYDYDYVYDYDHHIDHVVASPLVAPVASLAIRAIA